MTTILINSTNPDKESISNKQVIDISYNINDTNIAVLSGSSTKASVKVDDTISQITVVTPRYENVSVAEGRVYFTPIYTEQLDYDTWIKTVNKNFFELT